MASPTCPTFLLHAHRFHRTSNYLSYTDASTVHSLQIAIRTSPAVSGTSCDHLFSPAILDMPSRESVVPVTSPIELSDTWRTIERHYTRTPFPSQPGDAASKFIKRQLHRHEMLIRYGGEPGLGYYNLDRLKNERDAMTFVAHNTSIPVPRVLDWSVR